MSETINSLAEYAVKAKSAARILSTAKPSAKQRALELAAEKLITHWPQIKEANHRDVAAAEVAGLSKPKLDRLRLTEKVRDDLITGLNQVAAMSDPVGSMEDLQIRPNGLQVGKMRIPLGVIGFIYESRPNATIEAAALALKAGNSILLRGGKEAFYSNKALVTLLQESLLEAGLPLEGAVLVPTTDRSAIVEMCHLGGLLDLIIPRGGRELIELVQREARMPVLAHADGINHLFVDKGYDFTNAIEIAVNGKTQRPSTCNSLEKVLVHKNIAKDFIPSLVSAMLAAKVEIRGCDETIAIAPSVTPATEEDWRTEYLDLIITVKVVDDLDAALEHIATYTSHHTETICTPSYANAMRFLREADASLVLVNASPRFNDGFQLGLGAEIGISTSKLHAYGPMGVKELTTTKFVGFGQGQVRE